MLREWPVDDRIFEPKTQLRPVGLGNGPMPRERPVGTEAYELMPEERPVANLKLMGRPVDEKAEEPTPRETPVDDETYEPIPENADPRLAIRPVDVVVHEPTPRDVPVDNQTIIRRPADGEKSIPMTDGRLATGPKTIIRLKEGAVDQEAVPLLCCTKHLRRLKYRSGRTER